MSESPAEKPAVRFLAMIEIQSESHGLLRFRRWTLKASTAINRLCNEELAPRPFAERLLAYQVEEPLATQEEFGQWTDTELLDVAVKWWRGTEHWRTASAAVDSFVGFQSAIRQRNVVNMESLRASAIPLAGLPFRSPEPNTIERLTRDLSRQKSLLDFPGQSAIQKVIEKMEFAKPFSAIAAILDIKSAMPERLAIESFHERMRDAQLLSVSGAIEFSKLAAVASPLAAYTAEAERMHRQMSERFRTYETAFDSNRISDVLKSLDLSASKRFAPGLIALESVATKFKMPWIDQLNPEASITGIVRMAALTAATQARNPFDLQSVAAIREALGDWRDVKMPWRFLTESNLREQFYIDRGFDRALIQLPEPAFSQALENVGLVRPHGPPAEAEIDEIDGEEILRQRMSRVYKLLFRVERALRAYIDRVMMQKYGPDWERHRCHGNGKIYQLWVLESTEFQAVSQP